MLVRRLLVAVCVVVSTIVVVGAEPAAASCAAPSIALSPASGAAGSIVTVSGQGFVTCNDTVSCDVDGQQCTTIPPPAPITGLTIVFTGSDGQRAELATVNGRDFAVQVRVPSSAKPGSASFVVADVRVPAPNAVTEPAPFVVRGTSTKTARAQLPRTGDPMAVPLVLIAVALLAVGAAGVRGASRHGR